VVFNLLFLFSFGLHEYKNN